MTTVVPNNLLLDNHYVVVRDDMKELDVDISVALVEEQKKNTNSERQKALESLRTELRTELRQMSMENLARLPQSEKVLARVQEGFNHLK